MATLIGKSDGVDGDVFQLAEAETTIGRHDTNNIVIDDMSVSSFHCSIVRDGNKFTIHDLDSTNGVRVGGKKVGIRLLTSGDSVVIGSVQMVFEADDAGSATTAEPAAEAAPPAPQPKTAGSPIATTGTESSDAFTASAARGKGLWIIIGIAAVVAIVGVIALIIILIGP